MKIIYKNGLIYTSLKIMYKGKAKVVNNVNVNLRDMVLEIK